MGGAVAVSEGRGRKRRSLDAVINVVPAIDLLSCCIAFLLVTAVWTQIARLQAAQYGNGAAPAPGAGVAITLRLGPEGHVLETSDGRSVAVAASGRGADGQPGYDFAQLQAKLRELRAQHPDASAVTVAAEDDVRYDDLVHTIDACVGAGLANVQVTGHAG
jgi:biopolymer transport protein ExbD